MPFQDARLLRAKGATGFSEGLREDAERAWSESVESRQVLLAAAVKLAEACYADGTQRRVAGAPIFGRASSVTRLIVRAQPS